MALTHHSGSVRRSRSARTGARLICAMLAAVALAAPLRVAQAASTQAGAAGSRVLAPLNIGTVVWIGYGPLYIADALGLWKAHGLEVHLRVFNDPALIPPAIASGAVDGGVVTYDQVVGQDAKGQHQAVVMPVDYSDGGDAIVAAASVHSLAELKGQKIAFNSLSPSDFLLSYALSTQGLSEKDIVSAEMTPETIPASMLGSGIKVGVTYEPFVSQITGQDGGRHGFRVLYSSHDAIGLISDVLVFDRKQISRHPQEIRALMEGYLEGLDYLQKNPEPAARIIAKGMGITAAEVKTQLHVIHNPRLPEMLVNLERSKNAQSFATTGEVISRILKAKGQISAAPPFEETVDSSFVKALLVSPRP